MLIEFAELLGQERNVAGRVDQVIHLRVHFHHSDQDVARLIASLCTQVESNVGPILAKVEQMLQYGASARDFTALV